MPQSQTFTPALFTLQATRPPPMPAHEDPMNRLMESGADYLTDSEMLSLVLPRKSPEDGVYMARGLLERFGSLQGVAQASVPELAGIPGLSPRSACCLKAALTLSIRLLKRCSPDRPIFHGPEDVAEYMKPVFLGKLQEEFHVILLSAKNHMLSTRMVALGLVDRCHVHAREVFRHAINNSSGAVSRIVLTHLHPSGDPTPSAPDIECTRSLVNAGKIIGIDVMDHVIIGERTASRPRYWLSMREENLM